MKVPPEFEPELPEKVRRVLWKDMGRNDAARWKEYRIELEREVERRKRKAALRWERRKPVTQTPKTETPERTTHDFPYLTSSDIPKDGFRRATIIRPPEVTETKWGKRYRIALEFEDGDKRRWSMNDTTFWNLSDNYGTKASEWIGKRMELKVKHFRIQGKDVTGIVGEPVK